MNKKIFGLCFTLLLGACTITPKPLSTSERIQQAKINLAQIFKQEKVTNGTLDFNEALARGIKYNYDFRIKLVNTALEAGQLKLAEYTMFPQLNSTGSIYTRNNDFSSFGITTSGQPTDVLNSTPRTVRSAREGLSWNILDFGMGYVRAREQGERVLIAQEEARKQLQQLAQDIRVSYWTAYSAQQLMQEVVEFESLLNQAKKNMDLAIADKTIPKEELLNFQSAMLEGDRHLLQLKYKLDKAMIDLKHLLNLPLDEDIKLLAPPTAISKVQNLRNIDFKKLDAVTLVSRPELRSQNYQERIAKLGIKTAILQALPGITLNAGWNYNSNKFLVNRTWLDRSVDLSWNMLSLVSLPTAYDAAKMQVKYENLKLMALTLGVLTQTRYASSRYVNLSKEYAISHQQTQNAKALYKLVLNRHRASLASKQQVISAKLKAITAKMDEDQILSDLSTALGELYLSVGCDVLPIESTDQSLAASTKLIRDRLERQDNADFKAYINTEYDKLFPHKSISTSKNFYTLQISSDPSFKKLKKSSRNMQYSQAHYAKAQRNGHTLYVFTYGKYKTIKEAQLSLQQLPRHLREMHPWIRDGRELTWIG